MLLSLAQRVGRPLTKVRTWEKSFCTATKDSKVYELRCYDIVPQKYKAFMQILEENLHVRTRYTPMIGFWTVEIGTPFQVYHLWAYDSLEKRAKERRDLANDLEWQQVFDQLIPCISKMENIAMRLIPGTQFRTPTSHGVYEIQQFTLSTPPLLWLRYGEKLVSCSEELNSSQVVGAFSTKFGPFSSLMALWWHADLDEVSKARENFHKQQPLPFWKDVTSAVSKALIPASFSPLR